MLALTYTVIPLLAVIPGAVIAVVRASGATPDQRQRRTEDAGQC